MKTNQHNAFALLVACELWLLAPGVAPAWDACGHKTVAAIALNQHDPKTQKKVNRIFKKDPRGRHFIDAATWPDDIKQGLRNDLPVKATVNRPWHFVDIPYLTNAAAIDQEINHHGATVDPANEKSANVVTAIRFYTAQLKAGTANATAKADALSWLIHLVGDIHQPLHCVTVLTPLPNYTPPPTGDEG